MRNCAIAAGSALVSAVIGVIVIIAVLGDPAAPEPENPRSAGTPEAAAMDANAWHRQCLGAEGAWVHEGVNARIRDQLPNPASFTHERTIASPRAAGVRREILGDRGVCRRHCFEGAPAG